MNKEEILLLIVTAFLPPLIYAIWIRNTEKINRERWIPIFLCFIWGATIAVVAALILEVLMDIPLFMAGFDPVSIVFIMSVIIAPFCEELSKPLAIRMKSIRKEINELEDGLIYGAVAGLGFSATENLLYGWTFLSEGLLFFFVLMLIRSVGACLLHASATSWTGYGYSRSILGRTGFGSILPYFALAFGLHALYNFVLTFETIGVVVGLILAVFVSLVSIIIVRRKIQILDMRQ